MKTFDPGDLDGIAFAAAPPARPLRLRRAAALGAVLVVHLGMLLALSLWSQPRPPEPAAGQPIEVVLLGAEPPPLPPPLRQRLTEAAPPATVARLRRPAPVAEPPPALAELAPAVPGARIFALDGAILDIESQAAAINRRVDARATFDYQIAGVAEAESAFSLPLAIEYRATRFDRYWKPTPDLLTDVLERAVRASTLQVSLPVPGMPGYRVGCAIVVLAAAGGCGMSEPKVLVYDIDDPTTLSPEEAKACEQIWERLADARTQSEHRQLRQIYDLGCRLPLADGPAMEWR